MDDKILSLVSHSVGETRRLGALLGKLLRGDELICLEGELGTGKTSLIQGIGQGQGITQPITSPTFTLVNEYQGRKATFYHVDLYRLRRADEIVQAGIDAYFYDDGICVIEWAEKARGILPSQRLHITLEHRDGNERYIALQPTGRHYRQLVDHLSKALES